MLQYRCKKSHKVGTKVLINKKIKMLYKQSPYRLIESYVNDYYELNHVGDNS